MGRSVSRERTQGIWIQRQQFDKQLTKDQEAVLAELRLQVAEAVDSSDAEAVGAEVGVSGQAIRNFIRGKVTSVQDDTLTKYQVWSQRRKSVGGSPWEPAVFWAGYAAAILGVMEDAVSRQRALVEGLKTLHPDQVATTSVSPAAVAMREKVRETAKRTAGKPANRKASGEQ